MKIEPTPEQIAAMADRMRQRTPAPKTFELSYEIVDGRNINRRVTPPKRLVRRMLNAMLIMELRRRKIPRKNVKREPFAKIETIGDGTVFTDLITVVG